MVKLSSLLGFVYVIFGFAVSAGLAYFAVGIMIEGQPLWSLIPAVIAYAFAWYSFGLGKQHLNWLLAVSQRRLVLTNTGVEWPRGYAAFEDIRHIRCHYVITQKRQNFVAAGADHNVIVTLSLRSGRKLEIVGGQGSFTWFGASLGQKDAESLLEKLADLQRRTFDRRYHAISSSFEKDGFAYYDGKKIDSSGNVFFGELKIPISKFWLSQDSAFELCSRYKNGEFSRSAKLRVISLHQDRDVFLALVQTRFGLKWPTLGSWPEPCSRNAG